MPRARHPVPIVQVEAHEIKPRNLYFVDTATALLRLKKSTIQREIRMGRLQRSRMAGRSYFLGRHLLAWLKLGEQRGKAGS
jgi:hypothetical protein